MNRRASAMPSIVFRGVGNCWSIACDPGRNRYFTVGSGGLEPFTLQEFTAPPDGETDMVTVRNWGPINDSANRLGTLGKQQVWFTSLEWDESRGGLWASYGSHYTLPESVPEFLVFLDLDPVRGMTVRGPWKCPAGMVGRVRGGAKFAPPAIRDATGCDSMTFGPRAGGNAFKSWGPGLVLFNRPDPMATAGIAIPMTEVIYWPMRSRKVGTDRPENYYYSDCPTDGEPHVVIKGNPDADSKTNPPKPSYQTNVVVTETGFDETIGVRAVVAIDDRLAYIFSCPAKDAYSWYGNKHAHDGTSEADIAFSNSIDSVLFPGQKLVGIDNPRGYHAEKYVVKLAFIGAKDAIDAAAVGTPQQIPWCDFITLPDVFESPNITGAQFVPSTRTLLVMESRGAVPVLHAFHVPAAITPPVDPCQGVRDQLTAALAENESLKMQLAAQGQG